MASPSETAKPSPHVALFVTCLVDLMRPSVGFAAIKLLEQAGCRVSVPEAQTCCGQPAYNSGAKADAQAIAKAVMKTFAGFDYIVAPSGSCAGMLRLHYPEMFAGDAAMEAEARAFAPRVYELTSFLVDVLGWKDVGTTHAGSATYHDSCSSLRELGVKAQPRRLLAEVAGLDLRESKEAETCCGFGGLFCVKYPEISERIVDKKVDDALATGAGTLLAGDLGCLLNIAGRLKRRGSPMKVRHVAEVLAGSEGAPIGEDSSVR
ncbi:MAG: (Fe-S)-binding protein [Rhodospirillales bacterium]|nr:(Fe-S)-binding protein [Rhodospirillales bacterium]